MTTFYEERAWNRYLEGIWLMQVACPAPRVTLRVVVPPCDCCGAGADEICKPDCPERVTFAL